MHKTCPKKTTDYNYHMTERTPVPRRSCRLWARPELLRISVICWWILFSLPGFLIHKGNHITTLWYNFLSNYVPAHVVALLQTPKPAFIRCWYVDIIEQATKWWWYAALRLDLIKSTYQEACDDDEECARKKLQKESLMKAHKCLKIHICIRILCNVFLTIFISLGVRMSPNAIVHIPKARITITFRIAP